MTRFSLYPSFLFLNGHHPSPFPSSFALLPPALPAMFPLSARASSSSVCRSFCTSPCARAPQNALSPPVFPNDPKVVLNRYSRAVTASKSQGASQVGAGRASVE
jgi:hypothetical protein